MDLHLSCTNPSIVSDNTLPQSNLAAMMFQNIRFEFICDVSINVEQHWHRDLGSVIFWWHDDFFKWKHFPRYWTFVRGIHRSLVNSPHKGQWCGALMFSLICAWINAWVNNREAGDLRHHFAHYDITVMKYQVQASKMFSIIMMNNKTTIQHLG